jgi:peptidyl-prolyl cis-trans isomerase SurA
MTQKTGILFVALLLTSFCLFAQKKNEILVTIGSEKISKSEFELYYKKNNTNLADKKYIKSPQDYLDLFINFRLKVLEAKALKYDTAQSFRDEIAGYRKDLAKPYLTDVSYDEKILKTLYERLLKERRASHLLIRLAENATPADTIAAWNKINDLRKQILAGADFNEMATKYSEDPSAAQNKGLLGYFEAFQMVYPFEDMAYKTPVGQVSDIVRTNFGYHLIKVHDERPTSGEMKVAHIMKTFPQQASEEITSHLKLMADSIWQKASSGANFAELARKYSDDKQSSTEGGVLNWFSRTAMIPSFSDAAFALKKDGDISPVIKTPYGWHIIKRLEYRPVPPFEQIKPLLESKIKQNPLISKHSDEAFIKKLKEEYHLTVDESNLLKLEKLASDPLQWEKGKEENATKNLTLFSFANQKATNGEFINFLEKQKFKPEGNSQPALAEQLNKYIHKRLTDFEDTQLETKYPDFAALYHEYYDGILLFNISKDKIWDVASNDTLRLVQYFRQTSKKYFWGDRFKGLIIKAKDIQTKANIERLLEEREEGKDELLKIFNTGSEKKVEITEVTVEKGANPIVDYFIWSGIKPSGFDETTTFVSGEIVKNEAKELKDAWGLYSSDFQEKLENEWIDSLKRKYEVKINQKVLKQVEALQ